MGALAATVFAAGVASDRLWLHGPSLGLKTDGQMSVRNYEIPPGVSSIEVRIYGAGGWGSDEVTKDCVSIQGEKGRNGAGDGGPGLFCGDAVAIMPGRAGKL